MRHEPARGLSRTYSLVGRTTGPIWGRPARPGRSRPQHCPRVSTPPKGQVSRLDLQVRRWRSRLPANREHRIESEVRDRPRIAAAKSVAALNENMRAVPRSRHLAIDSTQRPHQLILRMHVDLAIDALRVVLCGRDADVEGGRDRLERLVLRKE